MSLERGGGEEISASGVFPQIQVATCPRLSGILQHTLACRSVSEKGWLFRKAQENFTTLQLCSTRQLGSGSLNLNSSNDKSNWLLRYLVVDFFLPSVTRTVLTVYTFFCLTTRACLRLQLAVVQYTLTEYKRESYRSRFQPREGSVCTWTNRGKTFGRESTHNKACVLPAKQAYPQTVMPPCLPDNFTTFFELPSLKSTKKRRDKKKRV